MNIDKLASLYLFHFLVIKFIYHAIGCHGKQFGPKGYGYGGGAGALTNTGK